MLFDDTLLAVARLNNAAFNWLVGEIEERFNNSVANPGEAIGTVAAQSIGEPTTQVGMALWVGVARRDTVRSVWCCSVMFHDVCGQRHAGCSSSSV